MTAKEHLQRVKIYHDLIEDTKLEIQMLCCTLDGLTGMSFDKEQVQTSLTDAGIENQLILKEQKELRLEQLKRNYEQILTDVKNRIDKLTNETERKVLTLRYLYFFEWSAICKKLNKTQDRVFSLHKRALKHYIL